MKVRLLREPYSIMISLLDPQEHATDSKDQTLLPSLAIVPIIIIVDYTPFYTDKMGHF